MGGEKVEEGAGGGYNNAEGSQAGVIASTLCECELICATAEKE
jgi:hypothetical protein